VCAELPLRIVANGDKKVTVLDSFMPRLGALLENQCGTLALVRWKLTDAQNNTLAQGTASKAKDWAPVVTPAAAATSTPPANTASGLQLPEGRRKITPGGEPHAVAGVYSPGWLSSAYLLAGRQQQPGAVYPG
jgi:hypothetical protein